MSPGDAGDAHSDRAAENFYARALEAADRDALAAAARLEDLHDEIATLRVLIRRQVHRHPDDLRAIATGMRLLLRSIAEQHRISPHQADHIGEAAASYLEQIAATLDEASADLEDQLRNDVATDQEPPQRPPAQRRGEHE